MSGSHRSKRKDMRIPLVLVAALAVFPLLAEDYYPHHNITFGVGAGVPQDQIKRFMNTRPGIELGYGYRFYRYFQADLGLNMIFGAANVEDYVTTSLGPVRVGDREYMLPMGGRAILPIKSGRFLLAAGGGGIWLKYTERLSQPSYYYRVDCPFCTSRSGWGSYALGNASYFLDQGQHFRVGVTAQFVRGHTNGQAINNVPAIETTDRWMNIFGEIGFSF